MYRFASLHGRPCYIVAMLRYYCEVGAKEQPVYAGGRIFIS